MSNNPDHFCTECGKPEKGNYKPQPGRTFQCSICLHNSLVREKKEGEEKKEALEKRPKRRS